ncbi:unnamed protein product [Caenorhabditis nigoni]
MLPTSNSGNPKKNEFEIEQPIKKTKLWYQWINACIRQYMIPEIFYFICLILILYRLQTLSNQNDRVLEIVNSMKSQFGNMERKLESLVTKKSNHDVRPLDNTGNLEQSIADVLKSMKSPTQDSTNNVQSMIPETKQSTFKTVQNETFRFNAADFLKGASVDIAQSSSSNLNPIIGYDQTNIVLLDRPHPPADKAWCTNDENPVLTINLVKYIKPISVSYQHSNWHGTIPNGAPKTYDVVACLDFYCEKWKPLVSNCEYNQYDSNEQMCNISSHLDVPLIGKVQFRYRENYGDTKMTCVHLVRVYGETKTPVKIEEKQLKSEEICTDLRWYYHNSYFKYAWANKNCAVLYDNNCCSECPECCQECVITDYNGKVFLNTTLPIIIGLFMLIFGILFVISIIYREHKNSVTRRRRRHFSKNRHTRVKI